MKSKLCLGCCFCFCFGTKISDSPFRLFEYLRRHAEFTLNQFPVYVVRKKHPGHSSRERHPKRHSLWRRMRSDILRNHLRVQPLKTNWLCPCEPYLLPMLMFLWTFILYYQQTSQIYNVISNDVLVNCIIQKLTEPRNLSVEPCGEASAAHITTTINSITHFVGAAIFGHFSCRGRLDQHS